MGYSGKQIIHPNQINIVTTAFTPAPKHLVWALQIAKAFEKNPSKGAFVVQGQMIDLPTVKQAQRLLARAPQSMLNQLEEEMLKENPTK